MKTTFTLAMLAAAGVANAGSTTAFLEDFEGAAQWTSATAEFSDGGFDFWGNSATTPRNGGIEYFGADGQFLAGMDLDGEGAALPITQTFDTFSIAGLTDLTFSVDLAEDVASDGANDWDAPDSVDFQYQVDGGSWTSFLQVVNNGDTFNSLAFVDGVAVSDTFSTFSADLTGVTGNDLAIRILWDLDSGDEDLAIDNLTVSGVPAPGAAALFGLAGLTAARRRR